MTAQRPDFTAVGLDPKHIGANVDDWFEAEGFAQEIHETAVKELLAEQLKRAMKTRQLTKKAFAAVLHTSRSQLDRILDPQDEGVTLATLKRAASAVGMTIRLELVVNKPG